MPVTLAVILSLLVAPLVRLVRRFVPNQVAAVLGAVVALTLCAGGLAAVIGTQAVAMAGSLPQYETTIRDKIKVVQDVTLGRMRVMQGEAGRMMGGMGDEGRRRVGAAARHAGRRAA